MHLNDGAPDDLGEPSFFQVEMAKDTNLLTWIPKLSLPDQAIDLSFEASDRRTRFEHTADGIGIFGLFSPKETEALFIESRTLNPRLNLDLVAKRGERSHIAARAAAISATHMLVQKAALELDVAPDEFEALEPRLRTGRPMLQIADTLINGSGLCRRLSEASPSGVPLIADILSRILDGRDEWPLKDFLHADHETTCSTSCYVCIQQYQNRRYHPLLDWRLGLAYLRAMSRPEFQCGLDGDFDSFPELHGWLKKARELAENVTAMRPSRWRIEEAGSLRLPCLIELDAAGTAVRRLLVIHPLWRADYNTVNSLGVTVAGIQTVPIDTFDLERRPLRAIEMTKDRPAAPQVQA